MQVDTTIYNKNTQNKHKIPTFKAINKFSYADFLNQVKVVYGVDDFSKIARTIYETPENLIGEGHIKKVYRIDGIKDYVLAVLKNQFKTRQSIVPFESITDSLSDFNFGQVIAQNNEGLAILAKVDGKEYSIPNWCNLRENYRNVNTEHAKYFFNNIEEISSFPVDSFEYFASEIKYLNENSVKIDSINPNNVLYNTKTKKLNIIDIDKDKLSSFGLPEPFNSVRDMIALLLDSVMHIRYFDNLPNEQKNLFINMSKTIIEKCKAAASNINLPNNSENMRELIKIVAKRYPNLEAFSSNQVLKDYDNFVSMYKDIL